MKCRKKDVGRPKINGHNNGISECVSGANRVKEDVLLNNEEKFATRCTVNTQLKEYIHSITIALYV
jgi:hypothetical protein